MTTPNLSAPPGPAGRRWSSRLAPPLLDALPQGVMLVDAEGRYLEINLAAADILGLDRETLLFCNQHECLRLIYRLPLR